MVSFVASCWFFCPPLLFAFFGYVLWTDWFTYLSSLPDREQQLSKAAHGVGVIVCGWVLQDLLLRSSMLPQRYHLAVYCIYAALAFLGVFWILIGATRAQIFGDARLTARAIVKFAVGWAVFVAWHIYQADIPLPWRGWIDPAAELVYLWCWATALTQIIICSRQRPRLPPTGNPNSYGGATWGTGPRGGTR
jgi:hypothetical protein